MITCLKWSCFLIFLPIMALVFAFVVDPRPFLSMFGIKCPPKMAPGQLLDLCHITRPCRSMNDWHPSQCMDYRNNLTYMNCEKSVRGIRASEFDFRLPGQLPMALNQCIHNKVLPALEYCPYVLQAEISLQRFEIRAPRAVAFVGLPAGALLVLPIVAPFCCLYRIVAIEGLKPGGSIPCRRILVCVLALFSCFVIAAIVPDNIGLVCFFLALALSLAAASMRLRREMTVLVETPQHWPRVQPLQDSLDVVQEFENRCATSQDLYDFKLEVLEVFAIEWPENPSIGRHDVEAGSLNNQRLYHGTSAQSVKSILSEGFDLKRASNGLLGQAVYFAETPLKSWDFSLSGYILACDVALGRTLELRRPYDYLPAERGSCKLRDPFTQEMKFESIVALSKQEGGQMRSREYGVYSVRQIEPKFLLKVRSRPKTAPPLDTVFEVSSDEDATDLQNYNNVDVGSTQPENDEHHDHLVVLETHPSTNNGSQEPRGQRRSHNQRRRERGWRNRVQIPTPDRSD